MSPMSFRRVFQYIPKFACTTRWTRFLLIGCVSISVVELAMGGFAINEATPYSFSDIP